MVAGDSIGSCLAVGELLWDVLPSGKVMGGAPANFASRLQALGSAVVLATRVGHDELGDELVAGINQIGLSSNLIQTDPDLPTGTVEVKLNSQGDPSFTINNNVAWENIELTEELEQTALQASLICFGTLAQRGKRSMNTIQQLLSKNSRAKKFLDINLRRDCYTSEVIENSLRLCDILKINRSEIEVLNKLFSLGNGSILDQVGELTSRFDLECCVVTLGKEGSLAVAASGTDVYVPGYTISVVDTIGSGDAFSAGFVHSYLAGLSLGECCDLGNIIGAISSSKPGALSPISIDELLPFQKSLVERSIDKSILHAAAGNF